MIWWWLLACGGDRAIDPAWLEARQALDAWEQGTASLDAGEPSVAAEAYRKGLEARPGDPLMMAWRARALAAAGDHAGAVRILDDVLSRTPSFAEARYNRAAYRMALGQVDEAVHDLKIALDSGASTPRQVLLDPDFAPHLSLPQLSFLPDAPFEVRLATPERVAFLGSRIDVELTIVGAIDAPLVLDARIEGPLVLERVDEDDAQGADGDRVRTLRWSLQVGGAGEIVVPGWTVEQGPFQARTAPVRFQTAAPSGHEAPEAVMTQLWSPAAQRAERRVPSAWGNAGGAWVLLGPGDRVDVSPRARPHAVGLYRRDGDVLFEVDVYPGTVTEVRDGAAGESLWKREGGPAQGG